MAGEYNVCNALCAVGILKALGYDHRTTLSMMASIRVPGRLKQIDAPEGCAVLIDYAHNGLSLSSVLQTLRPYTAERLICLVGSVGGRSQMRRADLGDAAAQYADLTVLTADNPDFEDPRAICEEMAASFESRGQDNYVIIPDRAEAIRAAVSMLREGDVLLLAGKGCENYQLIRGERVPLSEREIVARALRAFLLPL
jgi:UDP-N-acetylmuramoyl-L-alanyl-D-glutamate--2,6-diaminopimelate ligase